MITIDTVVVGCDVGKTHHQLHALDASFKSLGRRRTANTDTGVRTATEWIRNLGPDMVLVVDQKASYAALLPHHADAAGVSVLYVTGLQARRATELTPGRAKTDRIDAEVLATFGRTPNHRLPLLMANSELNITMRLFLGRNENLRCDFNRIINRLRNSVTQ